MPSCDEGGYQYQFVLTPADWLICSICSFPSREPYLTGCCGQTFCKSCLEVAKKTSYIIDACPKCHNNNFITIPHHQANKAVESLQVFCTNKKKGCNWQGEVNTVTDHIKSSDGCKFEDLTCPNECGMYFQRQHLTNHIEDECVGCKVDTVSDLQTRVVRIKHQLTKKFEVGISDIKKELQSSNSIAARNEQLAEEKLANKLIGWVVIPTLIVLLAWFVHHDMDKVKESFLNDLSLLDNRISQELVAKLHVQFQDELLEIQTAAQKRISELEYKLQQKINELDSVNQWFRWDRNISSEAAKLSPGMSIVPLIVKVSGYKEKIKGAQNMNGYNSYLYQHAVSFYTHPNGYKIKFEVSVDRTGSLAVNLYLEEGPYDRQLWWPLKGHCSVKLLNQISDSEHYVVDGKLNYDGHESRATRVNKGTKTANMWSSPHSISDKELNNVTKTCQYLKDDAVYFHVDYKLDLCNGTKN